MQNVISFESKFRNFVLNAFNKSVDSEGYIIEKDTGNRVISTDAQEIQESEFAGIKKGSEVYIKSDILSLIALCDDLYR